MSVEVLGFYGQDSRHTITRSTLWTTHAHADGVQQPLICMKTMISSTVSKCKLLQCWYHKAASSGTVAGSWTSCCRTGTAASCSGQPSARCSRCTTYGHSHVRQCHAAPSCTVGTPADAPAAVAWHMSAHAQHAQHMHCTMQPAAPQSKRTSCTRDFSRLTSACASASAELSWCCCLEMVAGALDLWILAAGLRVAEAFLLPVSVLPLLRPAPFPVHPFCLAAVFFGFG